MHVYLNISLYLFLFFFFKIYVLAEAKTEKICPECFITSNDSKFCSKCGCEMINKVNEDSKECPDCARKCPSTCEECPHCFRKFIPSNKEPNLIGKHPY